MSKSPPVVVKLGGSIITRKKEPLRARPKIIDRLAREIAQAWQGGHRPVIVLHGAGSFGHPGAERYGLTRPPRPSSPRSPRGGALTSYHVRTLHQRVLRGLLDGGLPAVSVPPFPIARNAQGTLQHFESEPFEQALDQGLVPVSFGDVVLDGDWGLSILSADTIARELARRLSAKRVLFVSDVAGVWRRDSVTGKPRVIEHVTPDVLEGLSRSGAGPDVTGGIRGKVETMLEISRGGVPTGLISGLAHGLLVRAIEGELVYGSWTSDAPA